MIETKRNHLPKLFADPMTLGCFGVLAPFAIRLKKETDEAKKRKIRRNMALILLLPIVAGLIAIALVVIALFMLYA